MIDTHTLLARIDASLERTRTILAYIDTVIEDVDRAATTAEQVAFEKRTHAPLCSEVGCTREGPYQCTECKRRLCFPHMFELATLVYCSGCLPDYDRHQQF